MTTKQSPFRAARRAGVPLLFAETADPAQMMRRCVSELNGEQDQIQVLRWDCSNGLTGSNEPGKELATIIADPQEPAMLTNPTELLSMLAGKASKLTVTVNGKKRGALIFLIHLNRFLDNPGVIQGLWNCRDALKSFGVSLVALGPSFTVPAELRNDVVVISEPLPGADELSKIVDSVCGDAKIDPATIQDRGRVVDTLTGVSAFGAEQVLAMSIGKEGIDGDQLWERKRKMIEQTKGLTIYKGKERFADTGGLANGKAILGSSIAGKLKTTCLVLIDELDKAMSASQTDTSGTTQDQNKVLLSYMQDFEIPGILFLGPPGTGKTMLAKAAANQYGIPLIMLDLGAMKGSLVGQSEQSMRDAIAVIHAVSNGRAMFLGACNRTENLPPELRRRFNYASLFFDLPDGEERESIWRVWQSKYDLTPAQRDSVIDLGWTGAEIRNCCLKSWAMDCNLSEAAKTIVPISKSASDLVESLRESASKKYISASYPGLYEYRTDATPVSGRRMEV